MRHFRPGHWVYALAAIWTIAAAGPALPQGRALSDKDMALLDSIAALMFNLEEGRRTFPDNEPVEREIEGKTISYSYVEPSRYYGTTKARYKEVADSKFRSFLLDLRLSKPCVIEVHQTIDYSQGNSAELFGEDTSKVKMMIDLRSLQQLEFELSNAAMAQITMKGDNILCTGLDSNGLRSCVDAYEQPVLIQGGLPVSAENAKEFEARRLADVETVLNSCQPQAG
jgi:hypothetical protein